MVRKYKNPLTCSFCKLQEDMRRGVDVLSLKRIKDRHYYCVKCRICRRYKSRHDYREHRERCRINRRRFMCEKCLRTGMLDFCTDDASTEFSLAQSHMPENSSGSSETEPEIYETPTDVSEETTESSGPSGDESISIGSEDSVSIRSWASVDSLYEEITSVVSRKKSIPVPEEWKEVNSNPKGKRQQDDSSSSEECSSKRRRTVRNKPRYKRNNELPKRKYEEEERRPKRKRECSSTADDESHFKRRHKDTTNDNLYQKLVSEEMPDKGNCLDKKKKRYKRIKVMSSSEDEEIVRKRFEENNAKNRFKRIRKMSSSEDDIEIASKIRCEENNGVSHVSRVSEPVLVNPPAMENVGVSVLEAVNEVEEKENKGLADDIPLNDEVEVMADNNPLNDEVEIMPQPLNDEVEVMAEDPLNDEVMNNPLNNVLEVMPQIQRCKRAKKLAICRCLRERDSRGRFIKSINAGPVKKGENIRKKETYKLIESSFLGIGFDPEILVNQPSKTRSGSKFSDC